MILTCPQCQAQYKLGSGVLGETGRDVRCVACSHVWFQRPEKEAAEERPQKDAATPTSEKARESAGDQSIESALGAILGQGDDADFNAVLSSVAAEEEAGRSPSGTASPPEKESAETESTAPAVASGDAEGREKKPAKKQTLPQETVLRVVTHNPLGMSANVFGAMVFLFCTFLTLAVVFTAKNPIVHRWPQMSLFYRALGFDVQPPGAGLKFTGLTAERRIDDNGKTLVIEGKMSNLTNHSIPYPPLRVILMKEDGTVAKSWNLKTGVTQISGGDIVPVMMQLKDAPDDGSTVELRVKGK